MEFTIETIINTNQENLYNAWLDGHIHSEMTGGSAKISKEVNGLFSAWDEYITGSNVLLEPYTKIIQKWRTSEFSEEEKDSIIEVQFISKGDATLLKIIHTNLPEHGMQYKNGWHEHYFVPMKDYFS